MTDHTCWEHSYLDSWGLLQLHRHGQNFTVKLWANSGIPVVYEWSCQAFIWRQSFTLYNFLSVTCSLTCHTIVRLTAQICRKARVSYHACCQCIQIESSLLLLSFTPALQSGSSSAIALHAYSHSLAEVHVGENIQSSTYNSAVPTAYRKPAIRN